MAFVSSGHHAFCAKSHEQFQEAKYDHAPNKVTADPQTPDAPEVAANPMGHMVQQVAEYRRQACNAETARKNAESRARLFENWKNDLSTRNSRLCAVVGNAHDSAGQLVSALEDLLRHESVPAELRALVGQGLLPQLRSLATLTQEVLRDEINSDSFSPSTGGRATGRSQLPSTLGPTGTLPSAAAVADNFTFSPVPAPQFSPQ